MGDSLEDLRLVLFADADFAGCQRTQRSTSGVVLMLVGKFTRFLLSAISKRQTAVSHSTPEAEMIAAAFALRVEGLPFMEFWDIILRSLGLNPIQLDFAEDNEAMIKICRNAGSQRLRHTSRTHRVNIALSQNNSKL